MKLRPLQPKQIYVVVRKLADWNEYPTPATVVRDGTILAIFTPDNASDLVLVHYNFSSDTSLVPRSQIYIFDWEARNQTNNGLFSAYEP